MSEKTYQIGEVSKLLNIPVSTIRYYDKHGLLPFVKRTEGDIRLFDEVDIDILRHVACFKTAEMPLKQIKHYFELYEQGDPTIEERYELIYAQQLAVEQRIRDLQEAHKVLEDKAKDYKGQMGLGKKSKSH